MFAARVCSRGAWRGVSVVELSREGPFEADYTAADRRVQASRGCQVSAVEGGIMVECAMKYCFVAHDDITAIDAGKTFLIFVQSKRVVFLNIKNGALLRVLHYIPHQVGNLCSMDPRIPVIPKHRKHSFNIPV